MLTAPVTQAAPLTDSTPLHTLQRLDLAALIIAMVNTVLQIIGTLWLLVVTLRNCNYRALAAAPLRAAKSMGRVLRGGRCCGDKPQGTDAACDPDIQPRIFGAPVAGKSTLVSPA